MKFDSNRAWQEASAAVSANRELLLALAGVFLVLPSFALSIFAPPPEPQPGATPQEMYAQLAGFFSGLLPWLLLIVALQLVGTLAMLTLFADRTRPTVGQAIKRGAIGALPCLGAQMLITLIIGLGALLLAVIGTLTQTTAILTALLIVAAGVAIWLWARFSLIGPVVAIERVYNPINAIVRSWRLTEGNAGRLLVFYFLLFLTFVVLGGIALGLIGVALAFLLPADPARLVGALMQSLFTAIFVLYFMAIRAAAHRQLAGPSGEAMADTFN